MHFGNIYLLMTLSELKWPQGEAHRQPAVPGRGEQAVQRGQPGLQRQQRHHHGTQHWWVPGEPVQPAQRLPAGQLAAQPPHHHPSHQWHAQLCRYPRLAVTQTHRGPSDQNISTRMCPYAPAPSWPSDPQRLIHNQFDYSDAARCHLIHGTFLTKGVSKRSGQRDTSWLTWRCPSTPRPPTPNPPVLLFLCSLQAILMTRLSLLHFLSLVPHKWQIYERWRPNVEQVDISEGL